VESPPFDFPPQPGDRALALAGSLERLLHGGLRRLRDGRKLFERPELSRVWPPRPALPESGPAGGHGGNGNGGNGSNGSKEPGGSSLLYLAAVPWDYRFQRPQQLARALHRLGHPMLYVEAFERQRLQPLVRQRGQPGAPWIVKLGLPGRPDPYRDRLDHATAAALAARLVRGLRWRPDAVILQLPFWQPLGLELRDRLGVPLVYDRIDLHAGFPGVPEVVGHIEERLMVEADLVTASSGNLVASGQRYARHVLPLPNAVAIEDFPFAPAPPAGDVVVGYIGALGPWVDAPAVAAAARAHPDWHFELAGRVACDDVAALGRLPNVRLLGEIPYCEVPALLGRLHAALIPFRDLPLTRAVDPVKLYEALAVGVPVVATALPGVAAWEEPLVYRYRFPNELPSRLAAAVAADDEVCRRRRREAVTGETWKARAQALLAELATLAESRAGACR
jgi:glycosyltransferase involved in cell wall biosynthesis